MSELGCVLYSALDYGLGYAEERELTPPLHALIEHMTSAGELMHLLHALIEHMTSAGELTAYYMLSSST